jgi:hypothetical protein
MNEAYTHKIIKWAGDNSFSKTTPEIWEFLASIYVIYISAN